MAGQIALKLHACKNGTRVYFADNSVILLGLDRDLAGTIITENFVAVCGYYRARMGERVLPEDLDHIAMNIVLHYLYMYCNWRSTHAQYADINLYFNTKDYEDPGTFDTITFYMRKKYPKTWAEKSSEFLGLSLEECKARYAARELFYNR